MKLTEKDKLFIERLKELMAERTLSIETVRADPGYFVLRGNHGDKVSQAFGMTRQGVRWRFWRLFNQAYVSAYETILFVERNFGPELRGAAMAIAQQRFRRRQQMLQDPFFQEANPYHGPKQD